jgi:hypothetical protein
VRADGSLKSALTAGEGFRDEAPQWANDGLHILFARLNVESCGPLTARIVMLNRLDGSATEVVHSLTLTGSHDEVLVVGQVPKCPTAGISGPLIDLYGAFSLAPVFDWWQPRR